MCLLLLRGGRRGCCLAVCGRTGAVAGGAAIVVGRVGDTDEVHRLWQGHALVIDARLDADNLEGSGLAGGDRGRDGAECVGVGDGGVALRAKGKRLYPTVQLNVGGGST